uniref:AC5 protein n=1 Tax=Crassocephalum yellow vein virus TaxID=417287 RepID=A0A5Q0USM8_9GEMI|nr:AC5 protein [Crassocephalum yellow vein virus]
MGTCHIQQQSIFSMVLVFPSFLVIVHYIIINTIKSSNYRLLLSCILSTGNRCLKPTYDLKAITLVILHSSRRRFIIIHIEDLLKIIGGTTGSPVTDDPEQNSVSVVLNLDVLVHPDLTDKIQRLDTKTFTNPMSQTISPRNVGQTQDLAHVTNIVLSIKRLDLTWAFTSSRDIWASVHPVHLGLSVHGPVRP